MKTKTKQKDGAVATGNLIVKKSKAGLGLFTDVPIKKGTQIIEYTGELISNKEADRRGGKYLFEINSKWTIDGKERGNKARYINHACKPNSESRTRKTQVFVYAIKNIKAGEELTYDYGEEYFNDFIKPVGCKCESCAKKKLS